MFSVHTVNMAVHSTTRSTYGNFKNKSGDKSSVSSILSDSSDNEIDDIALADAIINDDSDEKKKFANSFYGKQWIIFQDKELFSVKSGPINEAENICNILEYFELFFDKDIIQCMIETN